MRWLERLAYPLMFVYGWPSILLAATGLGIIAVPALLYPPVLALGWLSMLILPMKILSPPAAGVTYALLVAGVATSISAAFDVGDPDSRTHSGMVFLGVTALYLVWVFVVLYILPGVNLFTL